MKQNQKPTFRGVMGTYSLEKEEPVIQTDPMGSYTGLTRDPYEKPVQDADDL